VNSSSKDKEVKPRKDKPYVVHLKLDIPGYGTEEHAIKTARTATKDMAVRMSATLTGKYKSHVFTFNKAGRSIDDPDFE
jgi:hypothetical protein